MKEAKWTLGQGTQDRLTYTCPCGADTDRNIFDRYWHCAACNWYHFDDEEAMQSLLLRVERFGAHLLIHDSSGRGVSLEKKVESIDDRNLYRNRWCGAPSVDSFEADVEGMILEEQEDSGIFD